MGASSDPTVKKPAERLEERRAEEPRKSSQKTDSASCTEASEMRPEGGDRNGKEPRWWIHRWNRPWKPSVIRAKGTAEDAQ